jgi:hypothetical protein
MADFRTEIHKTDATHKQWIVATVLTALGVGIAAASLFTTLLRPSQQPTTPTVNNYYAVPPGAPASAPR